MQKHNRFIVPVRFCQTNTTKVVQSRPINTIKQIKHMLLHISGNVAKKITFDQSFVFSKHQNFSFENCGLGKKTRSNVGGTIQIF